MRFDKDDEVFLPDFFMPHIGFLRQALSGFYNNATTIRHCFSKAIDICERIGYPVIVKAAFGGGGMGMVIVNSKDDLEQAVHSAQEQAKAAFGRSEVFVEKYLINPKHIEIQFFGDKQGNVVHLGER